MPRTRVESNTFVKSIRRHASSLLNRCLGRWGRSIFLVLRGQSWAARAGLAHDQWRRLGPLTYGTNAKLPALPFSSSNGVEHGQSRGGAFSKEKNGTAFRGRLSQAI